MKKIMFSIITVLVVMLTASITFYAQDKAPDGKEIFVEKKCSGCHSVGAVGIVKKTPITSKQGPPDLSTVGSRHSPGFIARFIMKEDTLNGKKHLIKFNGNEDELKTLSQWLEDLKATTDSTKR
jgi:cytochrome c2